MGPTYVKLGQVLAGRPDLLPENYRNALTRLQDNVKPFPYETVEKIVESELGVRISKAFSVFGTEPVAAASLGQVHRATLPDGTDVACKLQYPDMPSTVEADLRQLKLAMAVYHRMDNAIQQDEIYKELRERLREELDYEREAAQMRLYGLMLHNEPLVHIPVPFDAFCTRRLLTMTWLDGRPLMRRLEEDAPQQERNTIATALFKAW